MPLYQQLLQSIKIREEQKSELIRSIEDGGAFFARFNDARMNLAFSSFSEEMKKALFEVIFFLHTNDTKYEYHLFPAKRVEKVDGVKKEVEYEANVNLFVPGSPAGVVGLENLSPIFKEEFEAFIAEEVSGEITAVKDFAPIFSISSLGSIGTVGHKKTASDLDLQIQYELSDFLLKEDALTDQKLTKYSKNVIKLLARQYGAKKKYNQEQLKEKSKHAEIIKAGKLNFRKKFPSLFEGIVLQKKDFLRAVFKDEAKRTTFVHEIIDLYKFHTKHFLKKELREKEKLLKERIDRIQGYVQQKYPQAEVYLFAYSNDDYRDGNHGTTLDSKEASGSAYELILNYETLMPGIQFTPMIPAHFLMPESVNSERDQYERLVDYIRFNFTSIFDSQRVRLVDLGATPPLSQEYMVSHSGAIYWESFKASSGNLPKALLNLLRIEMLFDPRFNISIIELVKSPKKIDEYAIEAENKKIGDDDYEDEEELYEDDYDEEEEDDDDDDDDYDDDDDDDDFFDSFGSDDDEDEDEDDEEVVIGEDDSSGGVKVQVLFDLEERFPLLLMDPWWLRYKALKIAFGPACRTINNPEELESISAIIDLGFALHIKVSDIFGTTFSKKRVASHREKFMVEYLTKAFPRSRRKRLEHIFHGEINAVLQFEHDLKHLFKKSMARVKALVGVLPGNDASNQDEYKIWFYYYEKHFDPLPNIVRKDILSHLKVPRGRLQIGHREDMWFFKSLQKRVLAKSQYNTFGELDHLPDEVELFEHKSFLHGIAHCIQNGYYGVTKKGTLLESRTHMEFAVGKMKVGKFSADEYAYIRPDSVIRLTDNIDQAFPPQEYDYRDCIYKDKEVTNIFICLNLLEYGRLSILYRDNMKTWYVDLFEHPEIEQQAIEYYGDLEKLLSSPQIHRTIRDFFNHHKFKLTLETKPMVNCWINPNSVKTHHAADKVGKKEDDLSKEFSNVIFMNHASGI